MAIGVAKAKLFFAPLINCRRFARWCPFSKAVRRKMTQTRYSVVPFRRLGPQNGNINNDNLLGYQKYSVVLSLDLHVYLNEETRRSPPVGFCGELRTVHVKVDRRVVLVPSSGTGCLLPRAPKDAVKAILSKGVDAQAWRGNMISSER